MTVEELEARVRALEDAVGALSARVQATEDVNEIKQLQRRYVDALIQTHWDDAVACFAEDAIIDVYRHDPVKGKVAIERWFKEEPRRWTSAVDPTPWTGRRPGEG